MSYHVKTILTTIYNISWQHYRRWCQFTVDCRPCVEKIFVLAGAWWWLLSVFAGYGSIHDTRWECLGECSGQCWLDASAWGLQQQQQWNGRTVVTQWSRCQYQLQRRDKVCICNHHPPVHPSTADEVWYCQICRWRTLSLWGEVAHWLLMSIAVHKTIL